MNGYIVLESGEVFSGEWVSGEPRAGEVVFNTSHSGYEEIATDPSYYSQIVVMTAPMQGNYGSHERDWESSRVHISGFIALEIQSSARESTWRQSLERSQVPQMQGVDTRKLVMWLRERGTQWGAMVPATTAEEAQSIAQPLIEEAKAKDLDWTWAVSRKKREDFAGKNAGGSRIAVLDYGTKNNIIRELQSVSREVAVFSGRSAVEEIKDWEPDGILASNGPGNPQDVEQAVDLIKGLLGWRPLFGICMGHQLLSLALGANTFKLRFGHRGGNHPVRDHILEQVYMTSQNHGYAVDAKTLPKDVRITHDNLYDGTIEGIECPSKLCMSVQFHPESHPGPRDAAGLFDFFADRLK